MKFIINISSGVIGFGTFVILTVTKVQLTFIKENNFKQHLINLIKAKQPELEQTVQILKTILQNSNISYLKNSE